MSGTLNLRRERGRLSLTSQELDGLITNIRGVLVGFEDPIRNIREAAVPLGNISSRLEQLIGALEQVQRQASDSAQGMREASEAIHNTSSNVMNTLKEYRANFDKVDKSTAEVFEEINRGLESYTRNIRGFVSDIDQSFNGALRTLSSAISEFQDAIEEMGDKMGK